MPGENILLGVEVQLDQATGELRQFERDVTNSMANAAKSLETAAARLEIAGNKPTRALPPAKKNANEFAQSMRGVGTAVSAASSAMLLAGGSGGPIFTLGSSLATLAAAGTGPLALVVAGATALVSIVGTLRTDTDKATESLNSHAEALRRVADAQSRVTRLEREAVTLGGGPPVGEQEITARLRAIDTELELLTGRGSPLQARAFKRELLLRDQPTSGIGGIGFEEVLSRFDAETDRMRREAQERAIPLLNEARTLQDELRLLRDKRTGLGAFEPRIPQFGFGDPPPLPPRLPPEEDPEKLLLDMYYLSLGGGGGIKYPGLPSRTRGGLGAPTDLFFGPGISAAGRSPQLDSLLESSVERAFERAGQEREAFVSIGRTTAQSITTSLSDAVTSGDFDPFLDTLGARITSMVVDAFLAATIQRPLEAALGGFTGSIGSAFGFGNFPKGGGGSGNLSYGITDPSLTPLVEPTSGSGPAFGLDSASLGLAPKAAFDVLVVPHDTADEVAATMSKRGARAIIARATRGRPRR